MKETNQIKSGKRTLALSIEISGCKHACSHCWADGHHYPPMGIADIERILTQAADFCRTQQLDFHPYPMHEVLGHPNALRVLQLFNQNWSGQFDSSHGGGLFEPLPTSGLALSTCSDRDALFDGIRALGIKTLWFAFHGMGDVHNRIVHQAHAFEATSQAVRLGREAGFRCGACVYVTKEAAPQIPAMIDFAREIGLNEIGFEVSNYTPIPRQRKYEAIRPELADLMPYAETLQRASVFYKDKWGDLSKYTEAHYVQAALHPQNNDSTDWTGGIDESYINLVCKSNQDLHSGRPGMYGPCHGNLAKGDIGHVLRLALEAGPYSTEKLYFPDLKIPAMADLAREFGNPTGQRVYFIAPDMRLRWLDLAAGLGAN